MCSKRYYEFISEIQPKHYMTVLPHPLRNDPLHIVSHRIHAPVGKFCDYIISNHRLSVVTPQLKALARLNNFIGLKIDQSIKKSGHLTEIAVARLISRHIPKDAALFLASSMPIRDMNMFAASDGGAVVVGSNRGASGIDGTIATAVGFARGLDKSLILAIGDLATLHDLNSLAMTQTLTNPCVIVILNNNGGGIFSFLPIHGLTQKYEQCFGTPHNLTFQAAADLFGFKYARPQSADEFASAYKAALHARASSIIEVLNDRTANLEVHTALQQMIARAIDAQMHKANGDIPWPKKARRPKPQYAGRNAARTRILNTKKQTA